MLFVLLPRRASRCIRYQQDFGPDSELLTVYPATSVSERALRESLGFCFCTTGKQHLPARPAASGRCVTAEMRAPASEGDGNLGVVPNFVWRTKTRLSEASGHDCLIFTLCCNVWLCQVLKKHLLNGCMGGGVRG